MSRSLKTKTFSVHELITVWGCALCFQPLGFEGDSNGFLPFCMRFCNVFLMTKLGGFLSLSYNPFHPNPTVVRCKLRTFGSPSKILNRACARGKQGAYSTYHIKYKISSAQGGRKPIEKLAVLMHPEATSCQVHCGFRRCSHQRRYLAIATCMSIEHIKVLMGIVRSTCS